MEINNANNNDVLYSNLMKQFRKELDSFMKQTFGDKIKESFLIKIVHTTIHKLGSEMNVYYPFQTNRFYYLSGDLINPYNEIPKMVVGVHRSNNIFLTDAQRVANERSQIYNDHLINQVIELIRLRNYSADFFRNKHVTKGDNFLFFPILYKLFVLAMRSQEILNKHIKPNIIDTTYAKIIENCIASLTLIEDNFLTNAYPTIRPTIEHFYKLVMLELYPDVTEEYQEFIKYDLEKMCHHKYPAEFIDKFNVRKNKYEKSYINYLHYGWLDKLDNYHNVIKNKPYSFDGLVMFLDGLEENNIDNQLLMSLYKTCHSYSHGNINGSKYPLLHYFELSIILYNIVVSVYLTLCKKYNVDTDINNINVIESIVKDYDELLVKYNQKTAENFELFYNYKK